MELRKITRNEKSVIYEIDRKGQQAEETVKVTAHEAPLKDFDDALQIGLKSVLAEMVELPDEWTGTAKIHSLTIRRTKAGTRSVSISFSRPCEESDRVFTGDTPFFRIDGSEQEEKPQSPELTDPAITDICRAINEASRYANGERQQALLPLELDEDSDTDETETENLPGV